MHQNQTLIPTILPQLQSTLLLQTPLLGGLITSMLKRPTAGFFTHPKGLALPFQSWPYNFGERLDQQAPVPQTEQTRYHPLRLPELDTNLQSSMNEQLVASLWIPLVCIGTASYRKRFSVKICSDPAEVSLHHCNFFYIVSQYFHSKLRRHH